MKRIQATGELVQARTAAHGATVMDIQRLSGSATGRSRAVAFDNLVFTVATAAGPASLQEQTRQVLARIEQNLADAGSDKTRLLSVTVYLTDIARKAEMDEVWNEWLGPENWPQRACVQAGLAANVLVEIVVIAARRQPG
jgi:enamine deaminase RidA (YjgF/YER057c/UK114 family)